MTYGVCVCADINGEKKNLELSFETKPVDAVYMSEQIEFTFRRESPNTTSSRAFAIDFIVFFEESSKKWKPLENCHQLQEQMQLYVFQTNLARETIVEIPPPCKLIRVPNIPQQSARSVHNPGYSTVDVDKVEALFREMDINANDSISLDEMVHSFQVAGIDFKEQAIAKLFDKADANSDNNITWEEFLVFADLFPNTTETLYWRLCHNPSEATPRGLETATELKTVRQRQHKLQKEIDDLDRGAKILETRLKQERTIAREVDPRRRALETEEQNLMNKEFALQFQRDMVLQAETQFSETVALFDSAAVHQGSPRRARHIPM